ncbi:glycosyltransferase family 2 protein [Paenibacillus medicaginis]|uniref:Glycosyltransferase family 2 protein n=1 Tax=Paenibacillus medicaginis TaxID=1470560 RepID=A0ABV5CBX0_9BACL
MDTPSISLCMIVKNEEPYLAQCLSSARSIVDEIIVVDTGSTDRSAAIASDYGAKVIHQPWDDSFSNARNRGLAEATCEWVLWLDADEVLDRNEAIKWKRSYMYPSYASHYGQAWLFVVPPCSYFSARCIDYSGDNLTSPSDSYDSPPINLHY